MPATKPATNKPEVESFERRGIITAIDGHEARYNFTMGPSRSEMFATQLEMNLDEGRGTSIRFNGVVGKEIVGQRVLYQETVTTKKSSRYDDVRLREKTITQKLIPDDKKIPPYEATYVLRVEGDVDNCPSIRE